MIPERSAFTMCLCSYVLLSVPECHLCILSDVLVQRPFGTQRALTNTRLGIGCRRSRLSQRLWRQKQGPSVMASWSRSMRQTWCLAISCSSPLANIVPADLKLLGEEGDDVPMQVSCHIKSSGPASNHHLSLSSAASERRDCVCRLTRLL